MYHFKIHIFILLVSIMFVSGVRIYILDDKTHGPVRKLHFQQMRERSKRQSHGINNNGFDRFPGPDLSIFDPILSPSFTQAQQQPPPTLNQRPLSLADMVDLTNPSEPNTPIDYLTPPSPTFQNFPPVQNNGPFSSSSNNLNSAHSPFQNPFPQGTFSNINPTVPSVNPSPISIANPTNFPTAATGFSDQNSNFVTPPTNFVTPPTNFVTPQSREISNNFGSFLPNEHQVTSNTAQITAPPQQGKWDLGFDANEILNPPLFDSAASPSVGDYETLTLNSLPRTPVSPSPISSSASSNSPVLAINPTHSQFTIHGSLRANEHGQSIIWGTFKPAPFTNVPAAASNDHLRFSAPPPHQQNEHNYSPFSDSYLPQGTATDSFIPHPEESFPSSFRRRQSQQEEGDENSEDETSYDKSPPQVKGPVYSFVKTFKNGSFKWGVRQGAFKKR